NYFPNDEPAWIRRAQAPAWPETASDGDIVLGGEGASTCGSCGGRTHTLLQFPSTSQLPFVSGLSRLTVETCLSCVGWEQGCLFYRHDREGKPHCLASPLGKAPQFPAKPLRRAAVSMVDLGPRWQWQSWGSANDREDLHRVGGHPTWIQS